MDTLLAALRQLLLFTAILTPLEMLWPAVPRQRLLRHGLGTDLGWALLMPLTAGGLLAGALGVLRPAWAALAPGPLASALATQPWGAQLALVLILGELGGYLYHRAAHAVPLLWRLHAIHHSSPELDWVSAHRQHPLEAAALLVIANLPAVMLGFDARTVLGVVLFQKLHTAFVHSNLRLPSGPWERLFAGPRFHRWHHARDGRPANFASMLPVVDLLFGTFALPDAQPPALGLVEPVPESLPGQLLFPLRRG